MNKEKLSPAELIRIGFFVGLGFSIPFALLNHVPNYLVQASMMRDFEKNMRKLIVSIHQTFPIPRLTTQRIQRL